MTTTGETLTLGRVLLSGASSLSERLLSGLDATEEAADVKAAIERAVPGLPLGPVIDGVCRSLQQALDVPLSGMLARAWDRSRELRAAIKQTRDSATAAVLVPLLPHTITSEHRPYVDVVVNGAAVARLVFPLKIGVQLDGIVLRIAGGRITDVMSGAVKIKGTLKFADFVLLEKTTPPISIPGSLPVAESVAA